MPAPSQYFDTIRLASADEVDLLDTFRQQAGARVEAHPAAADLAAFDADGTPVAAIRLCVEVDACLCGLAIADSRKRSALPYRLTRAWYELALARGAAFARTLGRGPHEALLRELGFVDSPARPGMLSLALHDLEHLRKAGSPLAAACERWLGTDSSSRDAPS